jgi:hypothetical protein
MNLEHPSTAAGAALIDGRSAFTDAVRQALAHAVQSRQTELCFVDPDFETWPLDDPQLLSALTTWAREPLHRLLLVAGNFDNMPRRFARFTEWRGNWAHVVEAHVTEIEPSRPCCSPGRRA